MLLSLADPLYQRPSAVSITIWRAPEAARKTSGLAGVYLSAVQLLPHRDA